MTSELSHHTWGILNKYAPLFQACCSVFPRNLLKDLLNSACETHVVLIFDICNAYDWLYSQYRGQVKYSQYQGQVKMVDMVLKAVFVNLSWRAYIIFCLNSKTFFWRYMLSLYFPLQVLLSNDFPKEPLVWFVILVAGLRIISPCLRHSEQVCSIVVQFSREIC